jgi:hypothetical protein
VICNEIGLKYRVMSHLKYWGGVRMLCLAATLLLRLGKDVAFYNFS